MTDKLWHTVINSDSDEELQMLCRAALEEESENLQRRTRVHRGSIQGHAVMHRGRISGHHRLYNDYFSENPVYTLSQFRRRFRMRKPLFIRIVNAVEAHDLYFQQKRNCAGSLDLSALQKVTAAVRMLAYGVAADAVDDYVRIAESASIESLKKFVQEIIDVFGNEYLRTPNSADICRLLSEGERRGFPGMLGSIDCMHWKWKNCPVAWKGMYARGDHREPSLILEAVASYDLWIWHGFFGLLGSHNDINVLDRSPIFTDLGEGRTPPTNYSINGHEYTTGYYLADGIYPSWATFVKTIPCPNGSKATKFAAAQESARKDVERAFGVLQACFSIVRGPARFWDRQTLQHIMKACIIMHNMIIEDERDQSPTPNYDAREGECSDLPVSRDHTTEFQDFIQNHLRIRDKRTHSQLQTDLVEHLWHFQGRYEEACD
ncbi:putative nuclease HARBI1 [Cinnamomum micranthum f. kanehirae]|uniref:Putative nuclease HARBI1 n=1 Tax=Cinnamomum micranthum f. kanehirae TaxID=337451 RepID=A0A443PN18_9MAGN|nr:putative nuclease HARBI1 [Cinnamomum micranthum f. kanehirae]